MHTAPFAAPLAYAGLGFLLLVNRMVPRETEEWDWWVVFFALGGFLGVFVLARGAKGDMVWFNVCLSMFERQPLFDALLLPAIENPSVTAITFVLDERQRPKWEREVWPKVLTCGGAGKVTEPVWSSIPEDVSFILADTVAGGTTECLLKLLGRTLHVAQRRPRYPTLHLPRHRALRVDRGWWSWTGNIGCPCRTPLGSQEGNHHDGPVGAHASLAVGARIESDVGTALSARSDAASSAHQAVAARGQLVGASRPGQLHKRVVERDWAFVLESGRDHASEFLVDPWP